MDLFGQDSPAAARIGERKKASKKAIAAAPVSGIADAQFVAPNPVPAKRSTRQPKLGDDVVFRSLYSGYFKAKIITVRFNGLTGECVDLDIFNESGKVVLHLTRKFIAADLESCDHDQCYYGERPKQF